MRRLQTKIEAVPENRGQNGIVFFRNIAEPAFGMNYATHTLFLQVRDAVALISFLAKLESEVSSMYASLGSVYSISEHKCKSNVKLIILLGIPVRRMSLFKK